MTVNAVNAHESKRKNASYLKATTVGGACGYIFKYALPVTKQEKDERYNLLVAELKKQTKEIKTKEIDAIRNLPNKTLAEDAFIRLADSNEVNMGKIKQIEEPVSSAVLKIVTEINNKGRVAKEITRESFTAMTKYIRPAKSFIGLGAGVSVMGAFIYNTMGRFSQK